MFQESVASWQSPPHRRTHWTVDIVINYFSIHIHYTTASHIALSRTLEPITGKQSSTRSVCVCVLWNYTKKWTINWPERQVCFIKTNETFIVLNKRYVFSSSSQKELTSRTIIHHVQQRGSRSLYISWGQDFDSLIILYYLGVAPWMTLTFFRSVTFINCISALI